MGSGCELLGQFRFGSPQRGAVTGDGGPARGLQGYAVAAASGVDVSLAGNHDLGRTDPAPSRRPPPPLVRNHVGKLRLQLFQTKKEKGVELVMERYCLKTM